MNSEDDCQKGIGKPATLTNKKTKKNKDLGCCRKQCSVKCCVSPKKLCTQRGQVAAAHLSPQEKGLLWVSIIKSTTSFY